MLSPRRWALSLLVAAAIGVVAALGPWSSISPLHTSPRPPAQSTRALGAPHSGVADSRPPPPPSAAGNPITAIGRATVATSIASPAATASTTAVTTRVWVLLAAVALFAITMVLLGFAAGYRPRGRRR